jgi:AsmA protein
MNGKVDRRRPVIALTALLVVVGLALVAPVLIGGRSGEPFSGAIVRASGRDSITISEPVALFSSPPVTLEQGTVALAGLRNGESRISTVIRTLLLGGGADLVLDGGKLVIDRAGSTELSSSGTAKAAAVEPMVSALAGFKFKRLALSDTTIIFRTTAASFQTLEHVTADITANSHGAVTAKGRLTYRGERLDFDVAFTLPDGNADAQVPVRASIKGKLIDASLNGKIAPGDRGQITAPSAELSVSDVRAAARWLGSAWPQGAGLGAFTAKGQLVLDERNMSFENAAFVLDGNSATGALAAKLGDERPALEGTLAFTSFDIAPYAAPAQSFSLSTAATDWLSSVGVPGLASPSLLREVDADLRISATNVMNGTDRLGRCAASLNIKNGKLYGELAEMELDQGGSGGGQFTVDMSGAEPAYTVRANLDDMDLAAAMGPRLGPAALDGQGDLTIDLSGHGRTETEIRRSITGTLSLSMEEGRVGLDIDALPLAAAGQPMGWGAVGAGTTSVDHLAAKLSASNGVLRAETVEAKAGDRTVTVGGVVDIDNSAIDLIVSVSRDAAVGDNQQPAKDPALAFKVRGPWKAPAISPAGPPGKSARAPVAAPDPG